MVKQQTHKVQQLEAKLQSREHALESLLANFDIQEAGNSKEKQHQHSSIFVGQPKLQNLSSQNILRKTSNMKIKLPQTVKEKLKNFQYKFAVAHEFPQQYLKVLDNPDAHRNDELDAISNKYVIKKVGCRLEKATQLMRGLDEEIKKAQNSKQKGNQRCQLHMPANEITPISKYAPKGIPIDLYNPDWYTSHTAGQKQSFDDTYNVEFLPDTLKSLLGNQNKDQRLSDKPLTQKYLEEVIAA
ncbi:hypothetical protein O181_062128 [Austropuccinia psidii MF-1]|uniref:Uncharacterized protein n=1 Tax=Austropuccinia psidii MF-1 TaxID=1389203 RepID=A0A9Q3HZ83_9BASI|nr:hypothetical protein [Austropuccinia psidii MF-1]